MAVASISDYFYGGDVEQFIYSRYDLSCATSKGKRLAPVGNREQRDCVSLGSPCFLRLCIIKVGT